MFLDRLIDEATQAVEPESMIPLVMGTKQVGGAFVLPGILFDVLVICRGLKQAGRCLPAEPIAKLWASVARRPPVPMPSQLAVQLILVGDHCQLDSPSPAAF